MIEIKVPPVGESISEVTLVKWIKNDGDWVDRDEIICELESEKATFELNAEQAGILHTVAKEGATLNIGDVACKIDETAAKPAGTEAPAAKPPEDKKKEDKPKADAKPAAKTEEKPAKAEPAAANKDVKATPVAQAIMSDKQVKPADVKGSGSQGRIMKQDVLEALSHPGR